MARGEDNEPRKTIPLDAPETEAAGTEPTAGDDAAKEAAQLGRGKPIRNIKQESEEAEHDRSQAFKNHFEKLSIIMLDVLFVGFILLAVVLVLHMILPEKAETKEYIFYIHGWLTRDQLDDISGILAGGLIAGLVADHFKRRMGGG